MKIRNFLLAFTLLLLSFAGKAQTVNLDSTSNAIYVFIQPVKVTFSDTAIGTRLFVKITGSDMYSNVGLLYYITSSYNGNHLTDGNLELAGQDYTNFINSLKAGSATFPFQFTADVLGVTLSTN
jgi:hypothetical protein